MVDLRAIPDLADFMKSIGLPKRILQDFTTVGNVGAGEDNLMSGTIPANTLKENGGAIHFVAFGRHAANANAKEVKVKIGGTAILASGAVALNDQRWKVEGWIVRDGVGDQRAYVVYMSSTTLVQTYTDLTKDETTALVLLFTGEATSNDDVRQDALMVDYQGAA
jgi:hypothetical protein